MVSTCSFQPPATHRTSRRSTFHTPTSVFEVVLGDLGDICIVDIPAPGSSVSASHDPSNPLFGATAAIKKGLENLGHHLGNLQSHFWCLDGHIPSRWHRSSAGVHEQATGRNEGYLVEDLHAADLAAERQG